jgi:hypothetical protein
MRLEAAATMLSDSKAVKVDASSIRVLKYADRSSSYNAVRFQSIAKKENNVKKRAALNS